jgi:hypothetical protein
MLVAVLEALAIGQYMYGASNSYVSVLGRRVLSTGNHSHYYVPSLALQCLVSRLCTQVVGLYQEEHWQ